MKYLDEFRHPGATESLLESIRRRVTKRWTIMEVCGGQTHGLLRYGIDEALADAVELIHGPGCPVCVTGAEVIDRAIELASIPNVLVTTFGDMLRVPGSRESLASARAAGALVRMVYSPLDAVALAEKHPELEVVFFAVGFETTAPATALAVLQAKRRGIENFSLLVAHVRVQPAMEAILCAPENRVQAFLAAGHVCTVVGCESYEDLCRRYEVPIVVTGFEPTDLATGIAACVEQLETSRHEVENRYDRVVQAEGNLRARQFVEDVFEACDRTWRGLGAMPLGGLRLRESWRDYDAERRFTAGALPQVVSSCRCRSGEVLSGRIKPPECAAFGGECRPEHPLGAPMVSGEGACAAYFQYHRPELRCEPRAVEGNA
ncbi:MAG: hydrogenase formation protein HypD [Planctomycetia bacterium]|nr:hydrogenase formation protein HypD [Planctomycetia bacterium]